jgi:hypothetical protein
VVVQQQEIERPSCQQLEALLSAVHDGHFEAWRELREVRLRQIRIERVVFRVQDPDRLLHGSAPGMVGNGRLVRQEPVHLDVLGDLCEGGEIDGLHDV